MQRREKFETSNSSKGFKLLYIASILLTVFGPFFLFFLKDRLIYFIYGYDYTLFFNPSAEFIRESIITRCITQNARMSGFVLVLVITLICLIMSIISSLHMDDYISNNEYFIKRSTIFGFIISFILTVFYVGLYVFASMLPGYGSPLCENFI